MSELEMREQFVVQAKRMEEFKLLEFHRFKSGEFAELAAEMAFIGYKMGLEVSDGK